jgi:hypothetical protein
MRVRTGLPVLARSSTHRLFLRELHDYLHAEESALALEKHATPEIRLLGESYRESADMALERALHALACWYEPKPLPGVFERLKSPLRETASPALEYLGHVLPRVVFRPVQRIFEASAVAKPDDAAGNDPLADRIRLAWESGDEWLRACAVHASRFIVGFDSRQFASGAEASALVRAELAALAGGRPAPPTPFRKEPPC